MVARVSSDSNFISKTYQLLVIMLLLLGIFIWALVKIYISTNTPLMKVEISGKLVGVTRSQLEDIFASTATAGFLKINLALYLAKLKKNPWIDTATIVKNWPSGYKVTISEHQPIAYWNDSHILHTNGSLIARPTHYPLEHLPKFSGPLEQKQLMLTMYQRFCKIISPLNLYITDLCLTPARGWRLYFAGFYLELGHSDVVAKLSRFRGIYHQLIAGRISMIDYVDLRYSNGLAIGWKTSV